MIDRLALSTVNHKRSVDPRIRDPWLGVALAYRDGSPDPDERSWTGCQPWIDNPWLPAIPRRIIGSWTAVN
jgi:hypothetical protein